MSRNEGDLLRIEEATSGFFKRSTRVLIAETLSDMKVLLKQYDQEDANTREAKLKEFLAFTMSRRQIAVQAGAKSEGDKSWAVAAACESWLQSILMDSPEDSKRVETIIDRLINRV